jgi:hypothetical protein
MFFMWKSAWINTGLAAFWMRLSVINFSITSWLDFKR